MPYKVVIDASGEMGYGDEATVPNKDKVIAFLANYISISLNDSVTVTKV